MACIFIRNRRVKFDINLHTISAEEVFLEINSLITQGKLIYCPMMCKKYSYLTCFKHSKLMG